jgi:hypothetical protein
MRTSLFGLQIWCEVEMAAGRRVARTTPQGSGHRELPFAVLDDTSCTRAPIQRHAVLAWAWQRLAARHGRVAIGGVARGIGWNRQHLTHPPCRTRNRSENRCPHLSVRAGLSADQGRAAASGRCRRPERLPRPTVYDARVKRAGWVYAADMDRDRASFLARLRAVRR